MMKPGLTSLSGGVSGTAQGLPQGSSREYGGVDFFVCLASGPIQDSRPEYFLARVYIFCARSVVSSVRTCR